MPFFRGFPSAKRSSIATLNCRFDHWLWGIRHSASDGGRNSLARKSSLRYESMRALLIDDRGLLIDEQGCDLPLQVLNLA